MERGRGDAIGTSFEIGGFCQSKGPEGFKIDGFEGEISILGVTIVRASVLTDFTLMMEGWF